MMSISSLSTLEGDVVISYLATFLLQIQDSQVLISAAGMTKVQWSNHWSSPWDTHVQSTSLLFNDRNFRRFSFSHSWQPWCPEGHGGKQYKKVGTEPALEDKILSCDQTITITVCVKVPTDFNMAEGIPLFPNATSMFIHSGNIINWNRLKRKPNQTSTEEVGCRAKTAHDEAVFT